MLPLNDFLKELNKEQREAVEWTDGPIMVIAGAGSGKTRVLTYKTANLIAKGVEPFQILALTFTNKAANEMKTRILQLLGNMEGLNVWMGTFHSIFARILRVESHRIGYPSTFTIYDAEDSKNLLKHIIKEVGLDPKLYNPSYVLHRISMAKTNLISAADYHENTELQGYDKYSGKPAVGQLYTLYQNRLFKASAMDFDDLLYYTNIVLRDFPDALHKYQHKFRYILVDEYQDTNFSQYVILKRLAAINENICVVGDDAQSIYGFRGANIQNILNFKKDYPDFKLFKLEQNYRSTQTICEAANSIIINNKDQIFKKIWTENEPGSKIGVLKANNDTEEGVLVAHSIFEHKMNKQLENSAFAILYRTNAQSRAFEESLRKLNIPYRIFGGLSFYKRREIKDLIAYFRLVVNPHDQESLLRVINYPPRGIGDTTLDKLRVGADEKGIEMWDMMDLLQEDTLGISFGIRTKITDFVTKIKSYQVLLKTKTAFELAKLITQTTGILKDLQEDHTPEGISRAENIEALLNAIKEFTESNRRVEDEELYVNENEHTIRTLEEFLTEVALLTDVDNDENKDDKNKVTLMTVHSAKGLEFPYVYIVGLEESLFPSYMSLNTRAELEEERRLFYVALTRAKEKVTLAHAENRYKWGSLTMSKASRFIEEIDQQYLELPSKVTHQPPVPRKLTPLSKDPVRKQETRIDNNDYAETENIQTGMEVEHERFGQGKVIAMEGSGPNRKATVYFPEIGQKQLLLRFAKLKII
jgi:DNA helicase II / ATP-dependent DNA helicase PcrA